MGFSFGLNVRWGVAGLAGARLAVALLFFAALSAVGFVGSWDAHHPHSGRVADAHTCCDRGRSLGALQQAHGVFANERVFCDDYNTPLRASASK